MPAAADLVDLLGPTGLRRFADWPDATLPASGAGIYTVWDLAGASFVYVGIAGTTAPRAGKPHGLWRRLAQHAKGDRSGDRFCIYVQDRFVLPRLTPPEIAAIAARRLSLDGLVRDHVRAHFGYRALALPSATEARRMEARLKAGDWPHGMPLLNPGRTPD